MSVEQIDQTLEARLAPIAGARSAASHKDDLPLQSCSTHPDPGAPAGWLYGISLLALLLAALPYVAGFLAAPRGFVFLGALNNVGDTGQYLAAIRQGMAGHLLYTNQYTSLRVAPILMYPLYTAAGLLFGPVHAEPMAVYGLLHLGAAIALLAALWRLCRLVYPVRPLLCYGLCLFGGGLYAPALFLSGLIRLPFAPSALTAPELSAFATLLISPHGSVGLAAELWAFAGYLAARARRRGLLHLAAGGLVLGLSYPFGLVVLLTVIGSDLLRTVVLADRGKQTDEGARLMGRFAPSLSARCIGPALAVLPAVAIALYYAVLFHRDPLWGTSNMLRLPPPGLPVLLAAFGPLALLAAITVRRLWQQRDVAPLDAATRLIAVWAIANGFLLVLPLPQSERLLNGWSVALALLAAMTLARWRVRAVRRCVLSLSISNVALALLYLAVVLGGRNPAYYAPSDTVAAARWLAAHTTEHDVVLASAGSGNLIVSVAPCRVVVGQNFETFHWAAAQRDVLDYYGARTPSARRQDILRRHAVTLVVAGPYERALGRFVPHGPQVRPVYGNATVRIFAVATGVGRA